jgi:hypothetical protein
MGFSSAESGSETRSKPRGDAVESFAILTNIRVLEGAIAALAPISESQTMIHISELRYYGESSTPPFSPHPITIPEDWGILSRKHLELVDGRVQHTNRLLLFGLINKHYSPCLQHICVPDRPHGCSSHDDWFQSLKLRPNSPLVRSSSRATRKVIVPIRTRSYRGA